MTPDANLLPEITAEAAIASVATGTPIIDVRERQEWNTFHAPAAVLLPLSEFNDHLEKLPDGEFLVICHSGSRSARVTEALRGYGHRPINVVGGMLAWRAAGGETVLAANA